MRPTHAQALTRRYALLAGALELAVALPMPVLVLHMTGRGLDIGLVGLAFMVRALLVVLLELPTGGLADAIGRRPVALASQVLTLASFAALLFVTGPATALLYAVLQGVGSALHSGAMDAWYVDELRRLEPAAPLQPHLARVDVAQAGGMLLGSAIGGLLPSLAAPLGLGWPLSGFGIALFVGVLVRAGVLVASAMLLREPHRPRVDLAVLADGVRRTPTILKEAVTTARTSPVLRWLFVAAAASGMAMVSIETFWQPIAGTVFGTEAADSEGFALLATAAGVAVLGGSLAVLRWGNAFPGGPAALAGASMLLRGVAMLVFALAMGPLGLAAGLIFVYFFLATSNVPHDTLLHEATPSGRRSSLLSVQSLVFSAGLALAAGPLAWLASATSPRLSLWVAGVATMASCVAYAFIGRRLLRPAVSSAAAHARDAGEPTARGDSTTEVSSPERLASRQEGRGSGASGRLADALLIEDVPANELEGGGR